MPDRQPPASRRGRPGYHRDAVLAVAVEVFNERGYDATTMNDLAIRLGLSKSAIYHHVPGKEALLGLALDRALDGLSGVVESTRARDGSAADRMAFLVRASVVVLLEQRPYVTLLLRVRGNGPVETAALERRRRFDRYLARLVREAMQDGDLRPGLDPDTTARLVFGLVNSLVEWRQPPDPRTTDLPDAVCSLVFQGLQIR